MYSKQPTSLVISRHYCYKKFILLNDDSLRIFENRMCFTVQLSRLFVCHLFATACLLYHIFQILSSTFFIKFFQTFKKLYKVVCFCRSVQATWLLYHKFSHLSTVNLNFLKTILFFSISEAIPCDSLFTIPLPQGIVKHFFTKKFIFFVQVIIAYFSSIISLSIFTNVNIKPIYS